MLWNIYISNQFLMQFFLLFLMTYLTSKTSFKYMLHNVIKSKNEVDVSKKLKGWDFLTQWLFWWGGEISTRGKKGGKRDIKSLKKSKKFRNVAKSLETFRTKFWMKFSKLNNRVSQFMPVIVTMLSPVIGRLPDFDLWSNKTLKLAMA